MSNALQCSASLIKRWGQESLPNGKTVNEMLLVDGVSLWDAVAPILAAFYLPRVIARTQSSRLIHCVIKPYLSCVKQWAKSLMPHVRHSNGCARWPSRPTYLLLGFSGYMYRDILEPLASYLRIACHANVVVLHDDGRLQGLPVRLRGEGIQSIWEHWDGNVGAHKLAIRRQLSAAMRYLYTTKALRELVSREGQIRWSQVRPIFQWLRLVYLPALAPYVALTQHILKEHRPALIVSPDVADPRTRLFCLTGRLMEIPSLEVQFGMYGEDSVEWQFCVAEKVAVWGERARQVISTHGVPRERIILTGSPRFDGLATVASDDTAARVRSRLGIPVGQVLALFASQYSLSHYAEFGDYRSLLASVKRAVFEVVDSLEGIHLVVKPHPLENVRETTQLANGCRRVVFVDKNEDIRELIKGCDVFITFGSTATMDALVAHKPVIFPAFPGLVWWDDMYLKGNVAVVVKSREELMSCLSAIVERECGFLVNELETARRCFLADWIYRADGQSAARIAAVAKQMIHASSGHVIQS